MNLKSKFVTVKKDRRCCGCMKLFQIGSKMRYEAFTDSGSFGTCYWCEDCYSIVDTLDWSEYEDGLGFGDLKETPEFINKHLKP